MVISKLFMAGFNSQNQNYKELPHSLGMKPHLTQQAEPLAKIQDKQNIKVKINK